MDNNTDLLYMAFDEETQMKLNKNIVDLLKDTNEEILIDSVINKEDFYKLIENQRLLVITIMKINDIPSLLDERLDCVLFTTMNVDEHENMFVNIEIRGEDILRLLKRELVYGDDRQMFLNPITNLLQRNLGFTANTKKLLKYFASEYEYHYPDQIYTIDNRHINIKEKLTEIKQNNYHDKNKQYMYGRCGVDDAVKLSKNPFIHIINATDDINPKYNPSNDIFFKIKKFLRIDKDHRYSKRNNKEWSFEYIEEII